MVVLFGLKAWSDNPGILEAAQALIAEGLFHYLELTPVPGTDCVPFYDCGIPVIIHATGDRWGVNIADRTRREANLALVRASLHWADTLGSELVILHPGSGELRDALEFLGELDDGRIAIENMPAIGISGEPMVGYTPGEIRALMMGRFGFCLDLNHAIKASVAMGTDSRALIQEFVSLGPSLFHIADGMLGDPRDEHLALGDGEYDLAFLKGSIMAVRDVRVTLETPRPSGSLGDDLLNRERFLRA